MCEIITHAKYIWYDNHIQHYKWKTCTILFWCCGNKLHDPIQIQTGNCVKDRKLNLKWKSILETTCTHYFTSRVISCFRCKADENRVLLAHYTVSSCNSLPTSWDNSLVPSLCNSPDLHSSLLFFKCCGLHGAGSRTIQLTTQQNDPFVCINAIYYRLWLHQISFLSVTCRCNIQR